MASYFAAFLPVKEGGYAVEFPDFPEAFTQGVDFEECMIMGADVLAITVAEYTKARKPLPESSSLEKVKAWAMDQLATDPDLNPSQDFLIQFFRAPQIDSTPVRISISLPKFVLDEADKKAASLGVTRSGFLAKAAQQFHVD